jgi:hypothetical protein
MTLEELFDLLCIPPLPDNLPDLLSSYLKRPVCPYASRDWHRLYRYSRFAILAYILDPDRPNMDIELLSLSVRADTPLQPYSSLCDDLIRAPAPKSKFVLVISSPEVAYLAKWLVRELTVFAPDPLVRAPFPVKFLPVPDIVLPSLRVRAIDAEAGRRFASSVKSKIKDFVAETVVDGTEIIKLPAPYTTLTLKELAEATPLQTHQSAL